MSTYKLFSLYYATLHVKGHATAFHSVATTRADAIALVLMKAYKQNSIS